MLVEDGTIKKVFAEPNFQDNPPNVALNISDAETMLDYLQSGDSE